MQMCLRVGVVGVADGSGNTAECAFDKKCLRISRFAIKSLKQSYLFWISGLIKLNYEVWICLRSLTLIIIDKKQAFSIKQSNPSSNFSPTFQPHNPRKTKHFSTIHILVEQVPFTETRANFYTSLTLTLTLNNRKAHAIHTQQTCRHPLSSACAADGGERDDGVTLFDRDGEEAGFSPREIAHGERERLF